MTRINSGIEVKELTDEHLLAEHREIKRLPFALGVAIKSGSIQKIPTKFTLGFGHVRFFLDKLDYIHHRYLELNQECERRGFTVTWFGENFNLPVPLLKYYGKYTPGEEDRKLVRERIKTRIMESKKRNWHYYGKRITKEEAVKLLGS
jgi:hypothetical protein